MRLLAPPPCSGRRRRRAVNTPKERLATAQAAPVTKVPFSFPGFRHLPVRFSKRQTSALGSARQRLGRSLAVAA